MTKETPFKIYNIGGGYESTYAIRCKDVKNIEEARNIILKLYAEWKDTYTDEEYQKKFRKPKVVILSEETCYIRYTGRWVEYGYESPEWDWFMTWNKTDKISRGAMKCYVFYVEDSYPEYDEYNIEAKENDFLKEVIECQKD